MTAFSNIEPPHLSQKTKNMVDFVFFRDCSNLNNCQNTLFCAERFTSIKIKTWLIAIAIKGFVSFYWFQGCNVLAADIFCRILHHQYIRVAFCAWEKLNLQKAACVSVWCSSNVSNARPVWLRWVSSAVWSPCVPHAICKLGSYPQILANLACQKEQWSYAPGCRDWLMMDELPTSQGYVVPGVSCSL